MARPHARAPPAEFLPFEITPELEGTAVLFDFMGPGDVLDLLISVSTYLSEFNDSK